MTRTTRCWCFVPLAFPLAPAAVVPAVHVHTADLDAARVVEVRGTGPDGRMRDWIGWHASVGPFDLGPLRVHAAAAWLRQAESGEIVAVGIADGTAADGGPLQRLT